MTELTTPASPNSEALALPEKSRTLLNFISHNTSILEDQIDAFARAAIALDRAQRPQEGSSSPPPLPEPGYVRLIGWNFEHYFIASQMNERWADGWKAGYKHGAWADRPAVGASSAPVAWCELTQAGTIAYFDGKPMVMPGPVGNDCHTIPLYAGSAPVVEASRSEKMRAAGYTARPSPFSCDECGKVFSSVTFLQAHECAFADAAHVPSSAVAASPDVAKMVEATCEWSQDGNEDGSWFSACGGEPWYFEAEDPTKNGMRFCIHCGKRMVQRGLDAATQARAAASEPPEAAGVDRG